MINNLWLLHSILILFISLLSMINQSLAFNNHQKYIHITSQKETVNMITNKITFVGNVSIRYGSIYIHADRIFLLYIVNKKGIIEGYGQPITFYQKHKKVQPIYGNASKIHYDISHDVIILSGCAYLKRLNSNIKGDRIIYFIKKQYIEAFGNQTNQVKTSLSPNLIHKSK